MQIDFYVINLLLNFFVDRKGISGQCLRASQYAIVESVYMRHTEVVRGQVIGQSLDCSDLHFVHNIYIVLKDSRVLRQEHC